MAPRTRPGLFVLEGKWSSRVTDVRTVQPVLAALQDSGAARHVRHAINDRDDLVRQMTRWSQAQHQGYQIGYVALHGSPGAVHIGRHRVCLRELGTQLPERALNKKVLHFGSCAVLDTPLKERKALREDLGVKVLTGFTEDVEWLESMAFELLLFEVLTHYKRMDAAEDYLRKNHRQFCRRLGFVMVR